MRSAYYKTRPGRDGSWRTGKTKGYVYGIRVPVRFVKWWVRRFSK